MGKISENEKGDQVFSSRDPELDSMAGSSGEGSPIIDEDIESVNQSTLLYIRKNYVVFAAFFLVVIIIFIWISLYWKVYNLFFLPVFLAFLAYGYIQRNIRHAFMRQFAKTNNFSYQKQAPVEQFPAPYLEMGHSRKIEDVVSGKYLGLPVSFFTFSCTVGYGKSAKHIIFTACEIHYIANLPRIFLDSLHHDFLGAEIFTKSSYGEIISLEGDFNKYFTLYVPKGFEREALQIFAPDIMAKLIDNSKQFDLEFFGDHLYVYSSGTIDTKQGMHSIYGLAKLLIIELAPVLERLK
jgi:hypothetical protein